MLSWYFWLNCHLYIAYKILADNKFQWDWNWCDAAWQGLAWGHKCINRKAEFWKTTLRKMVYFVSLTFCYFFWKEIFSTIKSTRNSSGSLLYQLAWYRWSPGTTGDFNQPKTFFTLRTVDFGVSTQWKTEKSLAVDAKKCGTWNAFCDRKKNRCKEWCVFTGASSRGAQELHNIPPYNPGKPNLISKLNARTQPVSECIQKRSLHPQTLVLLRIVAGGNVSKTLRLKWLVIPSCLQIESTWSTLCVWKAPPTIVGLRLNLTLLSQKSTNTSTFCSGKGNFSFRVKRNGTHLKNFPFKST